MPTPMQTILRTATRKSGDRLNILTFQTEPHYEYNLAKTGHCFMSIAMPGYERNSPLPVPANYHLFRIVKNQVELPTWADFDLIIAHDKEVQYRMAGQLSSQYQLPMVLVEHYLPPPGASESFILPARQKNGKVNVFVANCQPKLWGYEDNHLVNRNGVDTSVFAPAEGIKKDPHILWSGHHIDKTAEMCGLGLMQFVTGFPMPLVRVRIIGNNPGISRVPPTTEDLVRVYSEATLYLNTQTYDPIPYTMLEAMACGCPVVSINIGEAASIIRHGKNGLVANSPEQLKEQCQQLLDDQELATKLGIEARETIKKEFGIHRFVDSWQSILQQAIGENE